MTLDIDGKASWLRDVPADELRRIVDVVYRVHRFITAITNLDTLLERIMEESKDVAHAEACSLMLFDRKREELYFHVALGESGDQQVLKREIRLKLGQGIAGAAAASRQSINVENAQEDARLYKPADKRSRFETRSLLAVPLVDREELVGVLEVLNKVGGGAFTETDLRIMEIFAGLVATAIANARLIEQNLRAERLAAIGQAVAGLSHHTKNIITGMTAGADLIDQGLAKANLDVLKQSWPIFRRSTKRIANFVEDMLAFSKPREPVYEACDVPALVRDAAESFWALLARKNVELDVDVNGVAAPFYLDPGGIHRCLLNLLINAAQAVAEGGGKVRVAACLTDVGQLQLDVADNGPGVPDKFLNSIFDPFFSTKGTQGTGLGLAVTRKIVEEHGGEIAVMRSSEGGALFRIQLPPKQAPRGDMRG